MARRNGGVMISAENLGIKFSTNRGHKLHLPEFGIRSSASGNGEFWALRNVSLSCPIEDEASTRC